MIATSPSFLVKQQICKASMHVAMKRLLPLTVFERCVGNHEQVDSVESDWAGPCRGLPKTFARPLRGAA